MAKLQRVRVQRHWFESETDVVELTLPGGWELHTALPLIENLPNSNRQTTTGVLLVLSADG